jgi:hypothetical protein
MVTWRNACVRSRSKALRPKSGLRIICRVRARDCGEHSQASANVSLTMEEGASMLRTQRSRLAIWSALAALSLLFADVGAAKAGAAHTVTTPPVPGTSSATATPSCKLIVNFQRSNFSKPAKINNKWLPLAPGTKFVLDGKANWGSGLRRHRVVFIITDLTKVINGVRAVVIWERDFNAGQLVESELAFHAQDNKRNVWLFGEYPETYQHGKFTGAPDTWIAGTTRSKAGIIMLAKPRVGTPSYLQGLAPAIGFVDCAKVIKTGQKVCTPRKCYRNALVTDEWNPLVPEDGHQQKYYVRGIGNVRAGFVGGPEHEVLTLTKKARLCAKAVAEVREEALKLDRRAYRVSKNLYRHTRPAEHTLRARECR